MKFKCKRKLSELLVMVMIFTTLFTFGGIASNVNTVSAADNYVSDMTWTSSTCGSPGYTVKKDLNVVGNPIVIQGVSYTKGIGNHAFNDNSVGADVVVNISGLGYTSFDAYVGIDDGNANSAGSVVFKVIVDGIEKATTPTLTGNSSAYHLTADVTGGSTLTLRIMNGGDGYDYDWGTWGNAKLTGGSYLTKVNCGGSAVDGLSADKAYTSGSWGYVGGTTTSVTDTITNDYGYPSALKSVRYGESFNYKFDVANGYYTVKLYFAENWEPSSGKRPMDIAMNGSTVLSNFDVWADCGAKNKGDEQVFSNINVTNGQIDIHFAYHTGAIDTNSMVSAITVESAIAPTPTPTLPPLPTTNWVLNTQDTSITLAIANNRPAVYELKNPSQNYNWTSTAVALPLPTRVKVTGGTDYTNATWTYQNATVDTTNGKKVTLLFNSDQVTGLSVKSVWWASSSSLPGPIQHNYEIVNNTANSISTYPQLQGLDINVVPDGSVQLWRINKDAAVSVDPVGIYVDTLTTGSNIDVRTRDNTGGHGFMPLAVINRGDVHGLYVGWEWQTGRINVTGSGSPLTLGLKAGYSDVIGWDCSTPDYPTDRLDVSANSTFIVDSAYLGTYKGEVDDGTNKLKRWFWNNKVPANLRNDPTEPWTQYGGMWQYQSGWGSNQTVYSKGMNERLSNTGFECSQIDYGWWGPLPFGQYSFDADPTWWPGTMTVGGSLAHSNGFKFELYFSSMVNWSNKETFKQKWLDYGLDSWKNDFGRPDLKLHEWLKSNISNYRWENCDAAAEYKDFASAKYATVINGTDVYDPLSTRIAYYDSTYCFTPAQIIQVMDWWAVSDAQMAYALRSDMMGASFVAMAGTQSTVVLPSDRPSIIPLMTSVVTQYKQALRPLIREGDVYHILPRPNGTNWDGMEYYNPTNHKGVVYLFKPNSTQDSKTIYFKGLDRSRTYILTFTDRPAQNTTKTGAQLMDNGLSVNMTGTYVSDIILFE